MSKLSKIILFLFLCANILQAQNWGNKGPWGQTVRKFGQSKLTVAAAASTPAAADEIPPYFESLYVWYPADSLGGTYSHNASVTVITDYADSSYSLTNVPSNTAVYDTTEFTPNPYGTAGVLKNTLAAKYRFTGGSPGKTSYKFLHDNTESYTIVVLARTVSANGNAILGLLGTNAVSSSNIGAYFAIDDRSDADGVLFRASNGAAAFLFNASATGVITDNTAWNLYTASWTTGDSARVWVNGTKVAAGAEDATPSASVSTYEFEVWATGNALFAWNTTAGYFAELIVYKSLAFTQTHVDSMVSYINTKWSLSL